jgi:hypothetical protein
VTMTGSRFPGSRVMASDHLPRDFSISSGIYGLRLTAYSCGGSRGFAHLSARTAFPWLALAGTTNHKLASDRNESQPLNLNPLWSAIPARQQIPTSCRRPCR